ncbi:phage tail tape measure protein [Klebsiella aerogenes]|uniref:phage tail tape measure protein n=1 Tax=Klebsiella aerogenes TaxID=548 RepID=UPI00115D3B7F|nr:phage tail tape measure protein [Klebsiella aerogenes]
MAQQISDLVINLDIDNAAFTEQVARIKNQLSGLGDETEKVQARQQRAEAALATAAAARAAAMSDMQSQQSAAAAGLSGDMQKVGASVEETYQRVSGLSQQLRENEARTSALAQQQDALAESFFRQIDSVRTLSGSTDSLSAVQEQFRKARAQGNITQQDYLALISQTTARQKELQQAEEKASQSRSRFIQQLKSQVEAQGLSRTELLNLKAAQLGVTEEAAPLIARLQQQDEAWKRGTLSAGQYRQAIRMLPAQFTDIATSIAGGMPLWMVLMQQGGQISDSFGGVGNLFQIIKEELLGIKSSSDESEESLSENANALSENAEHGRGLLSVLTPTRLAIGGLVGAATLLAMAWYKGSQEQSAFSRSLIMTGNIAGKTTGQLADMARSVSESTGNPTAVAAEALNRVVSGGKIARESMQAVTEAVVSMNDATDESIDNLVSEFEKIAKSPVAAIGALNEQYHFLTLSTYNQIKALQDEGKTQDAARLATETYAETMKQRANQIQENLGTLESAWKWLGDTAKGAWDKMLDVGREKGLTDRIAELQQKIRWIDNGSGNKSYAEANKGRRQALQQELNLLQSAQTAQNDVNEARAAAQRQQDEAVKSQEYINALSDSTLTNAQKRTKEQEKLTRALEKTRAAGQAVSREEEARLRAAINEKYKDPRTPRTPGYSPPAGDRASETAQAELLTLEAQLRTLQQHTRVNDTISKQRRDLWEAENKYAVLQEASGQRQLSVQEKSLLAHQAETLEYKRQLAALGDKVVQQQKLNDLADQAAKFAQQQSAAQAKIAAQREGKSSREAQRDATMDRLRSTYSGNPAALAAVLAQQQETYEQEDALRGDWLAGAKAGWAEYRDAATDVYSSVRSVSQATFSGLTDQLTQLTTTGKASFKEFTASILKMIAQVINQLIVAYTVQEAMGWVSGSLAGGGNTPSGSYENAASQLQLWKGGYVPGYEVGGFTGHGGKYEPAGVVHRGEFVFTKEATSRIGVSNLYRMMRGYATGGYVGNAVSPAGTSPGGVMVNMGGVYISSNSEQQSGQRSAIDSNGILKQLKPAIISVVSEQAQRPGTPLWKAIKDGR